METPPLEGVTDTSVKDNGSDPPWESNFTDVPVLEIHDIDDGTIAEPPAPVNRKALVLLYLAHFFACWSDRFWRFGTPILLIYWRVSLLYVAIFEFVTQFACFALGTHIGQWLDHADRMKAMALSVVTTNISISISGFLIMIMLLTSSGTTSSPRIDEIILFIGLLFFGVLERLSNMSVMVATGKDWVVRICHTNQEEMLAANGNMRRLDLICEMLAPFAFGVSALFLGRYPLIAIIITSHIVLAGTEWGFLRMVFSMEPSLGFRGMQTKVQDSNQDDDDAPTEGSNLKKTKKIGFVHGWKVYLSQAVLIPSLSYVMLYMTVLSPGAIFAGYLITEGVSEVELSIFRGVMACVGIVATFGATRLIKRFEVNTAGLVLIWLQASSLFLGLLVFFAGFTRFFLVFVVMSRFGLMGFDMAQVQIMQLGVAESDIGTVNATERALTNLAALGIFAAAGVLYDPAYFWVLATISTCAVVIGALMYTYWARFTAESGARIPTTEETHVTQMAS